MNTRTKISLAALAGTAVAVTGVAVGTATSASAADEALTDQQLVALYEEERLAGDVYDALGEASGAPIFDQISGSEERHQSAVASLLEARGYDVNSLPTQAGEYSTNGYDKLYTDFVTSGSASVEDAYAVGVAIEEADIDDLEALLATTDDTTETRVLTALLNGSTHHLAAFSGETSPGSGTQAGRGGMGMQNQAGGYGMGMQNQAGGYGMGMQNRVGDCPFDEDQA